MDAYVITSNAPPPPEYPFEPTADEYSPIPFESTFEARQRAFFNFVRKNPAPNTLKAAWYELARLAAGAAPHEGLLTASLDYINARLDGADLVLHAVLRMVYQYGEHMRLSEPLLALAEETLLGFKYWPDEPGQDSMCTWSETHYLLFAAAGFLSAQRYPEGVFTNTGETGAARLDMYRQRLLRWMNLRFMSGFSQWLSPQDYDEMLAGLLNLADFARDGEISRRACMLIDLLLYDLALHSFGGVFAAAHARSDAAEKKWAAQEALSPTSKLLFGCGLFTAEDNMSAVAFALSPRYRMPEVLYRIAHDTGRDELLHRQRTGIDLDDLKAWDLSPNEAEDGLLLLNQGAYLHPRTAGMFLRLLDAYEWWDNSHFQAFAARRGTLKTLQAAAGLSLYCRRYERDFCRMTRESANLYTYRTPDYMLSSAQDYRKGFGGEYEHVWQATLGADAVCFTTHPARLNSPPPNDWIGNGCLPRLGQVKNVLLAIYRLESFPAQLVETQTAFTHAWLPRDAFDEVIEKDGWIFARCGDGYLALLSENPYEWQAHPGEDHHREVIVAAKNNIWICELGRKALDGKFSEWTQRVLAAEVQFSGSQVEYNSPSQGQLSFGWKEALKRDGRALSLDNYPRYASPYAHGEYPLQNLAIHHEQHAIMLDWAAGERTVKQLDK